VSKRNQTPRKRKPRDYRAEYARRIQHGLAKNLSRSQARGHANAAQSNTPPIFKPVHRGDALDRAIQNMARNGASLTKAAKTERISPERLRKYLKENAEAKYSGGKWTIVDRRAVSLRIATKERLRTIRVERHLAKLISQYWHAVASFMNTRSTLYLQAFEGKSVRDVYGVSHPFETRPNVLMRLEAKDELSFQELYDDTSPAGI
jgi:DNA-binding Lrp family transcriptional regulator